MNMFVHHVHLPTPFTKLTDIDALRLWVFQNCKRLAMFRVEGNDRRFTLETISFEDESDALLFQLALM